MTEVSPRSDQCLLTQCIMFSRDRSDALSSCLTDVYEYLVELREMLSEVPLLLLVLRQP